MPAYNIQYRTANGLPAYQFLAECDNDRIARVTARAMKLPSYKGTEVWRGEALIFVQPVPPAK